VGKTALVPMLNREIPIIADEQVDPTFGTGALKVTPGHDPNDYEIGKRHRLPMINIMNRDASLNENAGPYAGLDRFVARTRLWQDMEAAGLAVRVEERLHQVGHCERCHTIVEPLLSEQWWVKMKPLAEPAIEAVRSGEIHIIPQRFERVYYHWMENIRDWTISRQLWWGHRIPIWYGPDGHAFAAHNASKAQMQASAYYGKPVHLEQDPDVLDTWFSSGLWPFSTLGWPEQTEDLETYYPTTLLETGYDILFFWVARMIMLGLKCTGKVPFHYVYLHGMVRDGEGRKMTKSLGNTLDPLDLIAEYGSDALRFTLLTSGTPGNDMKVSESRVEANRNFANKIWNAARFVIMNLHDKNLVLDIDPDRFNSSFRLPLRSELGLADRWILSRLQAVQDEVTRLIESWQLGEAGRQLYEFLWNEYCDWYIEAAKVRLYDGSPAEAQATSQVLAHVLEHSLRLLHPYMPFVTETIWQNLPGMGDDGRALIVARWPHLGGIVDIEADVAFGRIQEAVRAIRNVRSEYNVEPARRIAALFSAGEHAALLEENRALLASLARLDPMQTVIASETPAPDKAVTLATAGMTIYLPLAGLVDLDAERSRLQKEIDNLDKLLTRSQVLLANDGFVAKAPADVIRREQAKLAELATKRSQLVERLASL
jgi:valyl-tRNA synthetase